MKKLLLLFLTLSPLLLRAQQLQAIASAGPQYSDHRFVITATVGEACINVPMGDALNATEGFQQGFLPTAPVTVLTAAPGLETPRLQALLFPNPTVDRLQVALQNTGGQSVRLQIYNRIGALVQEAETTSGEQVFTLESLPAGHYWLALRPAGNGPVLTLPFEKISL